MIIQDNTPPTLWSPKILPDPAGHELLDRALEDIEKEDQWVNDFIERLNYTLDDIGPQKSSGASAGCRGLP